MRLVLGVLAGAPADHDLHLIEDLPVDDRRVHDLLGPDPLVGLVPPQLGRVAKRDVIDVDEHFVLALFAPDLVAGIARVDQDRVDGELVPSDAAEPLSCTVRTKGELSGKEALAFGALGPDNETPGAYTPD
jgi:hypothetical protein